MWKLIPRTPPAARSNIQSAPHRADPSVLLTPVAPPHATEFVSLTRIEALKCLAICANCAKRWPGKPTASSESSRPRVG